MKNKYLRLFPDAVKIIMKLSPVGQTEIFAAMDARNNGNIFEFSDKGAEVVWWSLENQFKRDDEAYLKRCQKNRIASKMRWQAIASERKQTQSNDSIECQDKDKDKDNEKDKNPIKEKTKKKEKPAFAKPTVEEVAAYVAGKGYSVNPARFVAYYDSNGWIVGKTKMKDWKAAVRTWELKNKEGGYNGFGQHQRTGTTDAMHENGF